MMAKSAGVSAAEAAMMPAITMIGMGNARARCAKPPRSRSTSIPSLNWMSAEGRCATSAFGSISAAPRSASIRKSFEHPTADRLGQSLELDPGELLHDHVLLDPIVGGLRE